jgi:hypothetical protein
MLKNIGNRYLYKLKYFKIQEFIPKEIYNRFGEYSIYKLDERILITADQIREYFNQKMIINNWFEGGNFEYRGYRPENYINQAKYSSHYFGKAIDFNIDGFLCDEIRQDLIRFQDKFPYITRIEDGSISKTWVHIDIMPHDKGGILIFK